MKNKHLGLLCGGIIVLVAMITSMIMATLMVIRNDVTLAITYIWQTGYWGVFTGIVFEKYRKSFEEEKNLASLMQMFAQIDKENADPFSEFNGEDR
jgi:hypothetical protein